jgi:hypothetical protein
MLIIVPMEGKADVAVACPILGALVFLVDYSDKAVNILFVGVSYSKVVDDEGEQ